MIDNRIYTFLKLCEVGNYRKTAEALNMTQPAVTQHIHFLEEQYGYKLFIYKDRKLNKTKQCEELEKHALAMVYNDINFKKASRCEPKKRIAIGATKSIGEYAMQNSVMKLLGNSEYQLELIIDNTQNLLSSLHGLKLDVLLLEGFFNKNEYAFSHIKRENLVGICSLDHPFCGREVDFEELFSQHLILRESGSGTRNVFADTLVKHGYTLDSFGEKSVISSFKMIERAVCESACISFVYQIIPKSSKNLGVFKIKNVDIFHDFNFVYLKNADVSEIIDILKDTAK